VCRCATSRVHTLARATPGGNDRAVGLINAFRMVCLPDPNAAGSGEAMALA
jgi:hypothetical protein